MKKSQIEKEALPGCSAERVGGRCQVEAGWPIGVVELTKCEKNVSWT
jgi:hypothetical protein